MSLFQGHISYKLHTSGKGTSKIIMVALLKVCLHVIIPGKAPQNLSMSEPSFTIILSWLHYMYNFGIV